jgi:hypothetical protein
MLSKVNSTGFSVSKLFREDQSLNLTKRGITHAADDYLLDEFSYN